MPSMESCRTSSDMVPPDMPADGRRVSAGRREQCWILALGHPTDSSLALDFQAAGPASPNPVSGTVRRDAFDLAQFSSYPCLGDVGSRLYSLP